MPVCFDSSMRYWSPCYCLPKARMEGERMSEKDINIVSLLTKLGYMADVEEETRLQVIKDYQELKAELAELKGQLRDKKKPTIAELEAILEGGEVDIEILPTGEMREKIPTVEAELEQVYALFEDRENPCESPEDVKRLWDRSLVCVTQEAEAELAKEQGLFQGFKEGTDKIVADFEAELAEAHCLAQEWLKMLETETIKNLKAELAEAQKKLKWYGDAENYTEKDRESFSHGQYHCHRGRSAVQRDGGEHARTALVGAQPEQDTLAPTCPLCSDELRYKIEKTMTDHWDMKSCECLVCEAGRVLGCGPRDWHLSHKQKRDVTESGGEKP